MNNTSLDCYSYQLYGVAASQIIGKKQITNFFEETICLITTNGNRIVQNEFVAYVY